MLTLGYDAAGRLSTLASSLGTHRYSYDAQTGKLAAVTAPDGSTLSFAYDGALVTSVASAAVTGAYTVTYGYDSNLRLWSESVSGSSIAFGYDADELLTAAGALTLTRRADNGLLAGTTLGNVNDAFTYDALGAWRTIGAFALARM